MKKHTKVLSAVVLVALGTVTTSVAQSSGNSVPAGAVVSGGLFIPPFDPVAGRKLFAAKGCVVCHSINGVGGTDAPDLSAANMEQPMDAFDFAAKMWRGAPAMIAMQESELGAQIEFTGQELANIIAFVHDQPEQKKFSRADIPPAILKHVPAN